MSDAIAYGRYLRNIARICINEYRRMASGDGNEKRLREQVNGETRQLWAALSGDDAHSPFSRQAARELLARRFGALSKFEHSNGQFGLHYGHAVVDQQLTVSQYGREASMRFLSLDSMVSNGYSSWYWEHAQVGGWVDRDVSRIVQIRRPYLGGDSAWVAISDPQERSRTEELIAKSWDEDDDIARKNPFAYLPGLAARIQYRSRMNIRDELAQSGLSGPALRQAFIRKIEAISYEYSILAHEGRHAIDSKTIANAIRPGAGKEFRAKLSEIALSSHPFMALGGGILLRNIGDDTSHGQANERIMKGLVSWIETHSAQIVGFDRSRPALPQLDLLTEDQLIRAARAMDPLAD